MTAQACVVCMLVFVCREMPTRQQLLDAGRADLVNLVMKVGGFTQVRVEARSAPCRILDGDRCAVTDVKTTEDGPQGGAPS